MVYPSHWGPGEYDVADPNGSPYEIVRRSIGRLRPAGARHGRARRAVAAGLLARPHLRPGGGARADPRVRATAARTSSSSGTPAVTYTADALDATARAPALGVTTDGAAGRARAGPAARPEARAARSRSRRRRRRAKQAAARPAGQRARTDPDRHAPHDPRRPRRRLRPDAGGVPCRARAALEARLRPGRQSATSSTGELDVPEGDDARSCFTFDDSTKYQLALGADGSGEAGHGRRHHARLRPQASRASSRAGTFYVNREPFGGVAEASRALRWLVQNGFELGNHTHDHIPLRDLERRRSAEQLATGAEVIQRGTTRLPDRDDGAPARLDAAERARSPCSGSWKGKRYGPLRGCCSSARIRPPRRSRARSTRAAIPRIRTSHAGWNGEARLRASATGCTSSSRTRAPASSRTATRARSSFVAVQAGT